MTPESSGVSLKTTADFVEHAAVADGASEFFAEIFGFVPGHTRLICGRTQWIIC
jgi:hypothetical protein